MNIKQCAFNSNVCNLIVRKEQAQTFFDCCDAVAITRCPYKMFIKGLITKEKLNEMIYDLTH